MKCHSCGKAANRKCHIYLGPRPFGRACDKPLCGQCIHRSANDEHIHMKTITLDTSTTELFDAANQIKRGLHLKSGDQQVMLTPTIAFPEEDKSHELRWRLTLFSTQSHHLGHLFYEGKYQALLSLVNSDGCLIIDGNQFCFEFPLLVIEIV